MQATMEEGGAGGSKTEDHGGAAPISARVLELFAEFASQLARRSY